MTWRDKTCENCTFRVGEMCRRFPQWMQVGKPFVQTVVGGEYTEYQAATEYTPACAEYSEVIQPEATAEFHS